MENKFKVLIVDDHSVVRHGLALVLKRGCDIVSISHADNYEDLTIQLKENQDLLFLDISIPGGKNLKMVEDIRAEYPKLLIMMFSAYAEEHYALRYIHAGANGFLNKYSKDEEILTAVKSVINTGKFISDVVKEKIIQNTLHNLPINPLEKLSSREIEVAELLANGEGTIEISNKLNVQMNTVSTFKSRIFDKLGVNNVIKLVEILKIYKN
ncbi:response regulator transcription factor [Flavobacterium ajazii]|uniref:response regulator transcription factor n=1 Tax=Flavobacterium ajazii TaxID=2692318 RepID=UPI0013D4131F|nr:response regulator transcription factor [Flavobacterium ajazii]